MIICYENKTKYDRDFEGNIISIGEPEVHLTIKAFGRKEMDKLHEIEDFVCNLIKDKE